MPEHRHLCNCDELQCDATYDKRLFHDGDYCIHTDGTRHIINQESLIRVYYKFKNDNHGITITVTEKQYLNLYEVAAIEKCEIIGPAIRPISVEEKQRFNKKIRIACKQDKSHTMYLLE